MLTSTQRKSFPRGLSYNTLTNSLNHCPHVKQSPSISNWGTHSTSWLLLLTVLHDYFLFIILIDCAWFLPDWINVSCEFCSNHWNVSSKLRTDLKAEYEVGLRVQLRYYCLTYILWPQSSSHLKFRPLILCNGLEQASAWAFNKTISIQIHSGTMPASQLASRIGHDKESFPIPNWKRH